MRMFFFYFFRSSWNQLRTFVRSWAFLLFSALFVSGSFLWVWFTWYYRYLAANNDDLPTSFEDFFEVTHLSGLDVLELTVGLLILGLMLVQAIGAEKSVSSLFMQADVNLLFSSDLSPQTVLAFRVTNSLGLAIVAGIYLAIRLPSLGKSFSLTPYGAFSILLAWCLTIAFSVLLKILIYELGSRHPLFHRNLRWVLFALLAGMGIAFYRMYQGSEDQDLFLVAQQFFNAPLTRFVPVWGWIKGTMLYALEGNTAMSVCMLSLSLALIAGLAVVVQRLPADYYEETLSQAQETALLNEAANSEGAALLVMRARRRAVTREGFRHGSGSNVYFFRVLHNRLRTSHYFVTKTMLTYCFAALAAGLYVRYFLDEPLDYIPVLLLTVMVFFRTIVSPVTEDIRMGTFLIQPEPIWEKLFWSLLGGSCNCALDTAIPLMIGCAAAGYSPWRGLCYLPVLVSVDFFASASGAFTDVSIPSSIGTSFKQVIQVLLLYAGLIFDGVILSSGLNSGHSTAGFVLVTLLDVLFGGAFLGLTGVWLYPCKGRAVQSEDYNPDVRAASRRFTRLGLAVSGMYLAIHIAQYVLTNMGFGQTLALYFPIYGIGLPVFLLLAGRKGSKAPKEHALGLRRFLLLIPVCFFVMYAGNLLGFVLQGVVRLIPRPTPFWQVDGSSGMDHPVIQAVLLAFASPIMEEFVFRRCLIRRLLPYGEKAALVTSAFLFALFHNSVNQVCYAILLGLVFGYVYLKTGRLRYSMALHIIINTMTAILLPALLTLAASSTSGVDPRQVQLLSVILEPGVLALLVYLAGLLVLSLLGGVLFFYGVRERELDGNTVHMKTVLSSWGIIVFLVVAVLGLG